MKTWGIIILVFGCLALLGCLAKGNSAVGPLFWIGLGVYLLHRADQKQKENPTKKNEPEEL